MPKENTHIYFADTVKKTLPALSAMIDTYSQYFFMGSIAPDTFFYSKKAEIQDTSDFLHGKHNFHDKDEHKRKLAVYKHRRREVQLDEKVNKSMHIAKHIPKSIFTDTPLLNTLAETLNIPQQELIRSFQRQHKTNTWFRKSKHIIKFLHFLHKLGIIKEKTELALFYGQLPKEAQLADTVHYKDLFSDQSFSTDLESLLFKN